MEAFRIQVKSTIQEYVDIINKANPDVSNHEPFLEFIRFIGTKMQSFLTAGKIRDDSKFLEWLFQRFFTILSFHESEKFAQEIIEFLIKLMKLMFSKDSRLFHLFFKEIVTTFDQFVAFLEIHVNDSRIFPVYYTVFNFSKKIMKPQVEDLNCVESISQVNNLLRNLLLLLGRFINYYGVEPCLNPLVVLFNYHQDERIKQLALKIGADIIIRQVQPPFETEKICRSTIMSLANTSTLESDLVPLTHLLYAVFGGSGFKAISPLWFIKPLAKVLFEVVVSGKYNHCISTFQDCVGHLLYQCWLAKEISMAALVQFFLTVVGSVNNLQPFMKLLCRPLFVEISKVASNEERKLKELCPPPSKVKKVKPSSSCKGKFDHKCSAEYILLACVLQLVKRCQQFTDKPTSINSVSLLHLKGMVFLLDILSRVSVNHYQVLERFIQKNWFDQMLNELNGALSAACNDETSSVALDTLKAVISCTTSLLFILKTSGISSPLNRCMWMLTLPFCENIEFPEVIKPHRDITKELIYKHIKSKMDEEVIIMTLGSICLKGKLNYPSIPPKIIKYGLISSSVPVKAKTLHCLPSLLAASNLQNMESFINDLLFDAVNFQWTEELVLVLTDQAFPLSLIMAGVDVKESFEWKSYQPLHSSYNIDTSAVDFSKKVDLVSSYYGKFLDFIIKQEWKEPLMSIVSLSFKYKSFISPVTLQPLLSLLDHPDISVVKHTGKFACFLFDLWVPDDDCDIQEHPLFVKLTQLASRGQTKLSQIAVSIIGHLGRAFKPPNPNLWHYLVLLLEVIYRGDLFVRAAAHVEIKDILKTHSIPPTKLPRPLKQLMCQLLIEILNDKPTVIIGKEGDNNDNSYFYELATVFGFKCIGDLLHSIVDPFIPLLVAANESPNVVSCLKFISSHFNKVVGELLLYNFHYIFCHLVCQCSEAKKANSLRLLKDEMADIDSVFITRHNKILNQLLLHLSDSFERVKKGITFLATFSDLSLVSSDDLANYLFRYFLSILKFFDAKLEIACDHNNNDTGMLAIASLTELIKLMGTAHVTTYRVNVMALLRLSQRFQSIEVCQLACKAWDTFVRHVSMESLGPLLSEIIVALSPWINKFSDIVASVFTYLFITNKEHTKPYFNQVYIMPDLPLLAPINAVLKEEISSQDMNLSSLHSRLQHVLNGINHERSEVKYHAALALLKLLKDNRVNIQEMIIGSDMVEPVITDIYSMIMCNLKSSNLKSNNLKLMSTFGQCLGLLGAVDYGRLKRPVNLPKKSFVFLKDDNFSEDFCIKYIEHLKLLFLAARDAQELNCCAFALQEALSVFDCSYSNDIWNKLSQDTQEIIEPYRTSRYSPHYPNSATSNDIVYKPCKSFKYNEWIQTWVTSLIRKLKGSTVKKLLLPCTLIFKYNVQAAEFVLPHIFLVTLCEKNDNVTENIFKEVTAILEHCSSLKDTSEEKTALLCTQTLFTSLDYLEVWLHHDAATNVKEANPKGTSSTKSILPSRNFITVQNFLDSISKELLAHAAYNCHAFARALKYFQQHLVKFSHSQIQPNLNFLQEIFVALSDIDGVRGVSSIRSQQPSLQEQILEYQSIGDFRSALGCYEIAIQEQPKIEYYEESLSCLMRLGEFDTAYSYAQSKGRLAEMSETSQVFTSYCVEAAWKLRNWDLLDRTLKEKSCRNTWGVGLGRLLLAAKTKDTLSFHKQLNSLRASLMGPIVASKVELGSYQRAYSHIIKLHMLQDCEDLVNVIFESTDQLNNKSITPILKQWRNRLLATQDSYTAQEPILNLHRVLLTLANDVTSDKNIINNEIGSLWLKSAGVARNSNHLEVAHNHLLNASSYMLPELYLEKAELIKNQGRPNEALLMLQKFVKENKDLTPLSTNAMALLMIGKLMEDTDQQSQAVLKHYKDIIEIDSENEEAHYRLGRYYDRLLPLVDKNPQNYGDVLQYIVKGYGDSLMYGNKFIYHCMPRALSLWLEYGVGRESVNTQSQLNKITTLMNTFVDRLPPYHFFIGFSQIISHICHQDPQIFTVLEKIILKLIEHFPQQSLWMMVAAIKSRNSTRKSRCKSILNKAKRQYPEKQRLVDDMIKLSGHLLDVCKHNPPSNKFKLKMDEICRELVRLTKSQQFTCILVPLQSSLTVTLPTSHESSHLYNPFPGSLPTIFKFDDNVDVLPSMQKPKKIVILASDGKRYTMLCKPKDDLRKDCRLMEFNSVINKFLLRDPECRQRHLHIRTYAVIPLSEDNGIVEWVDNTAGYRYILNKIYQEKGLYTSGAELKKFASIKDKAILKDVYVNQLLPKFPAVFGEWFMKTFSDPISWYSSIQSFSRTAAVMSIVGYIVGLGDRHGENILIDYVNGDVVHVDFSHLFNKGSTLQVPEIVPFRLTHNMVNAMGVTKYEGTFKISCEMTMRVMRDQKHPLLCILKTLIHDPLLEWTCESNRGQSSREEISERAVKIVKDVDEKLCGRTGKTLPLSVESHVQSLIMDATDIDNLSQMYIGWAPFM